MLSSKERAIVRGKVSVTPAIYQIGKDGLTPQTLKGIDEALLKREVVKINVLQNSDEDAKTLSNEMALALNAEVVGVVGRKIILYRINPDNKNHIL